jgi:hypothetical protein
VSDRESHPAADLFPMMSEEELQALATDIRENGLRQPVVLDGEGRVLDGRNRLAACALAGVEPSFMSVNGDDPVSLVVSLNVKRRNITKAQTAIAAAEAWKFFTKPTNRTVGDMFGVSHVYVGQARALVEGDRVGADAVKAGALALKDAHDDLMRREGKLRGDSAERAKLRAAHPDLAERVDAEEMPLAEARAEAEKREAEAKQLRWAATNNVLDGLRMLEQPDEPQHIERAVRLLDRGIAEQRGEPLTAERLRAAAAFAVALADAIDAQEST